MNFKNIGLRKTFKISKHMCHNFTYMKYVGLVLEAESGKQQQQEQLRPQPIHGDPKWGETDFVKATQDAERYWYCCLLYAVWCEHMSSFQYFSLNSKYMLYRFFSVDDVFHNKKF